MAELRAQQNQASPPGPKRTTQNQTGKNVLALCRTQLCQNHAGTCTVSSHKICNSAVMASTVCLDCHPCDFRMNTASKNMELGSSE